jgi:esterase/lipase superfamily enzyme
MSRRQDFDVEPLRSRIAAAVADEDREGRLHNYLSGLASDAARQSEASLRRAVEITPELVSGVAAAETSGPDRQRIVMILRVLITYWTRPRDGILDEPGLLGVIVDALVTLEVLSRLDSWHFKTTKRKLVRQSTARPIKTLRMVLSDEVRRRTATVVEDIWEGVHSALDSPVPGSFEVDENRGTAVGTVRGAGLDAGSRANVETAPRGDTQQAHMYDVWYATNRRTNGHGFDNQVDKVMHYGVCAVEVPKTHSFGSIGRSWWKRWLKLEFSDDRLKIVRKIESSSEDQFFGDIAEEIAGLDEKERQVLFYLHGFNVSFEEAAIRAAQIGFDLKVPITAFFSWPSKASVDAYFADADRIAASEQQITDFLIRLAGQGIVHIIAHSMGNRGLARAIQRITISASHQAGIKFGQIILAAPDIEAGLFRDLARIYPEISTRTTMYVSARDRALGMSKWLQDSDRAGFTPPVMVVPLIDTVEVTNVDLTLLGHGYYAEAESVLYDIKELLEHNSPPERRIRLTAAAGAGGSAYWTIGA